MRKHRTWYEFGSDASLYWRLHDAVRFMARSGQAWKDRATYAFERLAPVDAQSFPQECQAAFDLFRSLDERTIRQGPIQPYRSTYAMNATERDQMVGLLLELFAAAEKARDMSRHPASADTLVQTVQPLK